MVENTGILRAMRILAIETSCDETAIAILEGSGDERSAIFHVRGNALLSQIEAHAAYGGVFPALAKREHAKNLVPVLEAALEEAELVHEDTQAISEEVKSGIARVLEREPGLEEQFFEFISKIEPPEIDAIAVTYGPGLEPALWVGINFAKALSLVWQKPIVAVNHMEGHVLAALAQEANGTLAIGGTSLPILALLISGGHTELVAMREWLSYELIGQTVDDAVGEAFDKVARMLGLPYPGGPEISKLAERMRTAGESSLHTLPRPMIDSGTCDFSFAGLKTAVKYLLKDREISETEKKHVARAFEDAVADVLWKKTEKALHDTHAHTLILGGGVSANAHIRRVFKEKVGTNAEVMLRIPQTSLTTDNAIMIGLAGFYRALRREFTDPAALRADGNAALAFP